MSNLVTKYELRKTFQFKLNGRHVQCRELCEKYCGRAVLASGICTNFSHSSKPLKSMGTET